MAEVLPASSLHESRDYFASPLLQPSSQPSFLIDSPSYAHSHTPSPSREPSQTDRHSSDPTPASPSTSADSYSPPTPQSNFSHPSLHSTSPSNLALDRRKSVDEDLSFPCYGDADYFSPAGSDIAEEPLLPPPPPDPLPSPQDASNASSPGPRLVADDSAVRDEPSLQVDYLSHDWLEEDIWSSWRHIVSKRKEYGETSRLENASWRTWAKAKYQLRTVSPETLNWLKDCDVTWLYGPLQRSTNSASTSEPTSRLSKNNSFLNKKPILKKRNLSEVMLQKSLSTSSLVKQAAASVQAQRRFGDEPMPQRGGHVVGRVASDFTTSSDISYRDVNAESTGNFPSSSSSGIQTPDPISRKHISFNEHVEQCIAVDFKAPPVEKEQGPAWLEAVDDSSDDELVMRSSARSRSSHPGSSRNSFSQEGKGIQIIAPTKLKYHKENLACPGHPGLQLPSAWQTGKIPASPSQETLRPARPSHNFLLPDDDDDDDTAAELSWEPSGLFGTVQRDDAGGGGGSGLEDRDGNLRRTPSGMFMPFDDGDDGGIPPNGIFGRVVDTVNTARDIAHVIWNVGWRK